MRQLTFTENVVFLVGAVMMVVGSAANVWAHVWAPVVYTVGATAFVAMQLRARYEGQSPTVKRLRAIMMGSDACFVITALLMIANIDNLFGLPTLFYLQYVRNNWVVTLLVAAILQLYSTHRITNELEKEAKKT